MAGFTPTGWSGGGGMPADMASALAAKYGIQQQAQNTAAFQAQTQRIVGNADAGYKNANTAEVAANALSQRGLQGAQAANQFSDATDRDFRRLFVPQQMYDQSRFTNAQAFGAEQTATGTQQDNTWTGLRRDDLIKQGKPGDAAGNRNTLLDPAKAASTGQPSITNVNAVPGATAADPVGTVIAPSITYNSSPAPMYPGDGYSQGMAHIANGLMHPSRIFTGDIAPPRQSDGTVHYSTGTARVPGKGLPTKDTVKAKLAPGEAVLNAAAAEMMGRHNIAALNAHGAMAMGMPPATGKGNKHKAGTSGIPSLDALYAEKSPMVSLGAPIAAGRVGVGAP